MNGLRKKGHLLCCYREQTTSSIGNLELKFCIKEIDLKLKQVTTNHSLSLTDPMFVYKIKCKMPHSIHKTLLLHFSVTTMPTHSRAGISNNVSNNNSFESFFETWLARQQSYLDQLVSFSSPHNYPQRVRELQSLVGEVLSHYQHYYEAKSRAASDNVFLLFSPPWFSTFERSFLWLAGFKPMLAYKILEKSVGSELNPRQVEKVQRQKEETRMMEKSLNDEMVKIQDSIVGPTWIEMVIRGRRLVDGQVDDAIDMMRESLKDLVTNADLLRAATARELVDMLTPLQAAKFLATTAKLQLRVRAMGLHRDASRILP